MQKLILDVDSVGALAAITRYTVQADKRGRVAMSDALFFTKSAHRNDTMTNGFPSTVFPRPLAIIMNLNGVTNCHALLFLPLVAVFSYSLSYSCLSSSIAP